MIGAEGAIQERLERNQDGTLVAKVDLARERRKREIYRVVDRFDSEAARAARDARPGPDEGFPVLPSGSDTDDELFRDFGVRRKPVPNDKGGDGDGKGQGGGKESKWRKGNKKRGNKKGKKGSGQVEVPHAVLSADPEGDALEKRREGDGLFEAGEWKSAADCYTKAIKLAGQVVQAQAQVEATATVPAMGTGTTKRKGDGGRGGGVEEARLSCLRGRAQCYLKLGKPVKAAKDLAEVIVLRPGDIESRVRRAEARKGMGELQAALSDAKAARKLVDACSDEDARVMWSAEVERVEADIRKSIKGKGPPRGDGAGGGGGGGSSEGEGDEDFLDDETSSGDGSGDEDEDDEGSYGDVEKKWKSDQKREALLDAEDAVPVKMSADPLNPHGNAVPKAFASSSAKAAEWSYSGGTKLNYHMKVNWIEHLETTGQEYGKSSGFRLSDHVNVDLSAARNPFLERFEATVATQATPAAALRGPAAISPAARATLEGLPLTAPVPVAELVKPGFKPGAAAFGAASAAPQPPAGEQIPQSPLPVVNARAKTKTKSAPSAEVKDAGAGGASGGKSAKAAEGSTGESVPSKKRKKNRGPAEDGAREPQRSAAHDFLFDAGASFFAGGGDDAAKAAAWKQQSAALTMAGKASRKRSRRDDQRS